MRARELQMEDNQKLAELYAIIRSSCPDEIEMRAKRVLGRNNKSDGLVHSDIVERAIRPVEVKRAFTKAVKHFAISSKKYINERAVNDIEDFFAIAVEQKSYNTLQGLSKFLETTPEIIVSLAHYAQAQCASNIERKKLSIEAKKNKIRSRQP